MSAERPFEDRKRPPYIPQYGNADVVLICREAGLDPSHYATQDYFTRRGLWGLIELFSDGEVIIEPTGNLALAKAAPEVRHGEFYSRISQLRQDAQKEPGSLIDNELNKLARLCGTIYANRVVEGMTNLGGTRSVVQIALDQREPVIRYANRQVKVTHDMSIMDIGPGIEGRQFIDLQALLLKQRSVIQYIPISQGPFVNQFLMIYGQEKFRKDPKLPRFKAVAQNGFFVGREDGMLAALEEILSTPQPAGRHDICDVVICNGLGTANRDEFIEGLKLVPNMIKPEGHLLLGLPIEKIDSQGPTFSEGLEAVKGRLSLVHQVTSTSGSPFRGRTTTTYAILKQLAA